MSDPSEILKAIVGAEILAFPTPASVASPAAVRAPPPGGDDASSQTGGSGEPGPPPDEGQGGDGRKRRDGESVRGFYERLAFFPRTDLGNAERFAERFAQHLRYCPDIGWLWWDGRRWSHGQAQEEVKRCEHFTARAIQDEAAVLRESDRDVALKTNKAGEVTEWLSDKLAAWGRASESSNRLSAISLRAGSLLAIAVEQLDADKMKFCVANGTLAIAKREGEPYVTLGPHEPGDFITKISPVVYDPAAVCARFDRFMDEVQPPGDDGKREMQRFLRQWAGLSLTGDTSEQKITFHYGKGRNGKSVWVNTISHVAGDYADSIGIESFLDSGKARAGGQATPDLACLPGVRMLTTSEPKKGATLDEGLIKLFSGGDKIRARHLNKDFFAFVPQAKLTMQGNYRPKVVGADEGIWNRLVLVPWGVFFPPKKRDPGLLEALKKEASGILNRLLDGLTDWLDHGLIIPGAVAEATADYRSDSDPLGRFLEACTRTAMGQRVQASDMHALFCAWAKTNGETVWSAKGLAAALKERGLAAKKSANVFWLDIALTKAISDFVDHNGEPWRGDASSQSETDFEG